MARADDHLTLPPDLPVPEDDGAAGHLAGLDLPPVELAATDGTTVRLDRLAGRSAVFAYPRTGQAAQRLTLLVAGGRIERALYPVFPPDRAGDQALAALGDH